MKCFQLVNLHEMNWNSVGSNFPQKPVSSLILTKPNWLCRNITDKQNNKPDYV